MRLCSICLFSASMLLLGCVASGQVELGTPNFSASDSHEYDAVNLANNSVVLRVPGMHKAGALPLTLTIFANSSLDSSSGTWTPTLEPGSGLHNDFLPQVNNMVGPLTPRVIALTSTITECPSGSQKGPHYQNYVLEDGLGTLHPFGSGDNTWGAPCTVTTFTDWTRDGSGYTWVGSTKTLYDRHGAAYVLPGTTSSMTDTNGNSITLTSGVWTDSMGLAALTSNLQSAATYTWTDVNGGSPNLTQSTTNLMIATNFGCSGVKDLPVTTLGMTTGFALPDGRSLGYSYEPTHNLTGDYTGRIYQISFPEGGYAQYSYSGGTHGIDCTFQNTPTLTRTLSNGDTTTYTITHNLISGSVYNAVNVVIDPGGNETDYTFTNFSSGSGSLSNTPQVLTQVIKYQGNGSSKSLLETIYYCYNTAFSSCSQSSSVNATPFFPITSVIEFRQLSSMSTWSATETDYDSRYGNVTYSAQYDYGASSPTHATTTVYGSCSNNCNTSTPTIAAIGSYIYDRPGEVVTTQNGSTVAQSNYTYDAHGNLLSTEVWTGSSFLGQTTNNVYNSNGTPSKTYDVANYETDYTYSAANYSGCSKCTQFPFPTTISSGGLSVTLTYNGVGGVVTSFADANGNASNYCYTSGAGCTGGSADPYWRVLQTTDPYGATILTGYPLGTSPDTYSSSFTFGSGGSGNSIDATTTTTDFLGRAVSRQHNQSATGVNYDTVTTGYSFSGNYYDISSSQPCSTTSGGTCTLVHTAAYDPLGRLYSQSTTGNEAVTHTYSQNDDLRVLSPAPSGENNKQVQNEYDGLGRLTKSCQISSSVSGNVSCGENTNQSANGVLTTTSYGAATGSTTISSSRGVQTRTTQFDALGRPTSRSDPESGNTTYRYDTVAKPCNGWPQPYTYIGDMVQKTDADQNCTVYLYDSLHRLTDVGSNQQTPTNPCKRFRYDNSSGYPGSTKPTGLANTMGRLIEAATDTCISQTNDALLTDEWFSYDKDGRLTDVYEWTQNSGGYYHTWVTYFANGAVSSLNNLPGYNPYTYTLDGEGRQVTAAQDTTTLISGATFNASSQPTSVQFGTAGDSDSYQYDSATGRMTNYTFSVNSVSESGTPKWNANGTLGELDITDGFDSGGTQTCHFGTSTAPGYDDLGRLLSDTCGSLWSQTFSYDQYDNVTKLPGSSISWNPGYNPANNQYSQIGAIYDAAGNLQYDSFNTYTWDVYGKMSTARSGSSGAVCGTSGTCVTYDAFGRAVERNTNGNIRQILFSPLGKTAIMNGQTVTNAYIPLPGGESSMYASANGGSGHNMEHHDWRGSVVLSSSLVNRNVMYDRAFAAFGEMYDNFGDTTMLNFTGDTQDIFSQSPGLYDTPSRELQTTQGRWISPDPAGAGWNLYAYGTNPLSTVDPTGTVNIYPGSGGCSMPGGVNEFCSDSLMTADAAEWTGVPTLGTACSDWFFCADLFTQDCDFDCSFASGEMPNILAPQPHTSSFPSMPEAAQIFEGEDSLNWPVGSGNPLADLWQALGLPSLPCQSQFGPWCDASMLPNPSILDAEQGVPNIHPCLNGLGPVQVGQSRCGDNGAQANPLHSFTHPTGNECDTMWKDAAAWTTAGNALWIGAKGAAGTIWGLPWSGFLGAGAVATYAGAAPPIAYALAFCN